MANLTSTTASDIDGLQEEVIRTLEGVDGSTSIVKTGYFNHTYTPDIVLRWPASKEERYVFLRASSNDDYLREDITLLHDRNPIFVPVNGLERAVTDGDGGPTEFAPSTELQEASVAAHALITEPASLDVLRRSAGGEPISSLAARSVLQGGAGLISPSFASQFDETLTTGFYAALSGEDHVTSNAIRASFAVLDEPRLAQINELFQAAWVGGGQQTSTYPGLGFPASNLEPSALLLLLNTISVNDDEFWLRIARNLEMKHLAGLTISTSNAGFQRLMRAAAPRLKAKAIRATGVNEAAASDVESSAVWAVNGGILTLRVGRVQVDLSPRSVDEFAVDGYESSPTVKAFVRRAREVDLNVLRVVLSDGDRTLEYASEDGTSVVNDERITALADGFNESTVARTVVRAEGRPMNISFDSSTGVGHTRTIFQVSSLVQSLVPLLLDMTEAESTELRELFEEPEADEPDSSDEVAD